MEKRAILVWEQTDWVRFGGETARWITGGRQSRAARRVSCWKESGRCGRLWEAGVAGFPKDVALPYLAIAIRNSLRACTFPAALPPVVLGVGSLRGFSVPTVSAGVVWVKPDGQPWEFVVPGLQTGRSACGRWWREDVAARGAPQSLVYSDAGYLEHLVVLAVVSWREQEAIIRLF